uniref:Uncharacterized protein n=1 Tax=Lepeophtheirus salmonis TaxID=72036 RepID=A0A0K2U847_LEPSM
MNTCVSQDGSALKLHLSCNFMRCESPNNSLIDENNNNINISHYSTEEDESGTSRSTELTDINNSTLSDGEEGDDELSSDEESFCDALNDVKVDYLKEFQWWFDRPSPSNPDGSTRFWQEYERQLPIQGELFSCKKD